MARFVFAMNVSLDGYVDHDRFAPGPDLFRHWTQQVQATPAAIYGRRIWELMRYWETDQPGWGADEHAFATAWRSQRKWVVSRTLGSVGANATLISQDVEAALSGLKASLQGDVDVCGTVLAHSMGKLALIDEYRLYLHPVVLGQGKPYFAGPLPLLHLTVADRIDARVIRLTYVPEPTAPQLP
jgi:dihydrofolate reductase